MSRSGQKFHVVEPFWIALCDMILIDLYIHSDATNETKETSCSISIVMTFDCFDSKTIWKRSSVWNGEISGFLLILLILTISRTGNFFRRGCALWQSHSLHSTKIVSAIRKAHQTQTRSIDWRPRIVQVMQTAKTADSPFVRGACQFVGITTLHMTAINSRTSTSHYWTEE